MIAVVLAVSAGRGSAIDPGSREHERPILSEEVEALLAELGELIVDDRMAEAFERARVALGDLEEAGDRLGQAICLTLLAFQHAKALETEMAIERLDQARKLLKEIHHDFAAAAVTRLHGALLHAIGRSEQAELSLRQGLGFLEGFADSGNPIPNSEYWVFSPLLEIPTDLSDLSDPFSDSAREGLVQMVEASLRTTLGELYLIQHRLDEAETELVQALELSRSASGPEGWTVLTWLALLRQEQGRYEEARQGFKEALRKLESEPGNRSVASIRRERITVYELMELLEGAQGRPEEALARNTHDLEEARAQGDRLAEAMLLRNRASLLRSTGEDAQSVAGLLEVAWRSAFGLKDPYLESRILTTQANHALATNALELAVSYREQALARLQALQEPQAEIMAWVALGLTYQVLGAHDRVERPLAEAMNLAPLLHSPEGRAAALFAETLARSVQHGNQSLVEGLTIVEGVFENPPLVAFRRPSLRSLIQAGQLILQEADSEKAVNALVEALEEARKRGEIRFQPLLRIFLGHVYKEQGQLRLAQRELRSALKVGRQLGDHHLVTTALSGLAETAWIEGRRNQAARLSLRAVRVLERTLGGVRVDDLLIPFLGTNTEVYERAIITLVKTGRVDEAFSYTERARSKGLLRLLGNQRIRAPGRADSALATKLSALRSQMAELEQKLTDPTIQDFGQTRNALEAAWRRHDDLLVRIKLADPRLAELVSPAPVDLEALRNEVLDADTTLVSFYLLLDRVVAWVIDCDRLVFIPTQMLRDDLGRIGCLTSGIQRDSGRRGVSVLTGCDDKADLSTELYEKLLAQVMPHVRRRKLVLVPHDALHYLPFAALRNPKTGRYLIQDHTLSYAPSASVLRLLRREQGTIQGDALVVGDPVTNESLPELAGARREARIVARLFGERALLGNDATESRVRASGAPDVLHLAVHGIYRPENPSFSYLALASGGGHDGRLEMHEIFEELDLRGVRLVVLSACETALGERTGGDDVLGFIRAFLHAGSPAVVATLWSIHDEGSAKLIAGFYRGLLDGLPASEALRRAQLKMLRQEEYRSPYYWAGFTLVGEALIRSDASGDFPR